MDRREAGLGFKREAPGKRIVSIHRRSRDNAVMSAARAGDNYGEGGLMASSRKLRGNQLEGEERAVAFGARRWWFAGAMLACLWGSGVRPGPRSSAPTATQPAFDPTAALPPETLLYAELHAC